MKSDEGAGPLTNDTTKDAPAEIEKEHSASTPIGLQARASASVIMKPAASPPFAGPLPDTSTVDVVKPQLPRQRNFTLRLGELAIFLAAVIGAVALGLGISSYFAAHLYVLAYLAAYAAFRFADLLVREDATLWTDRAGFARRVAYQLPILLLFAAAPFERTYIYGAEAPRWAAGLGLLIELAGLWLALGARIQLGFFSTSPQSSEGSKLVRGGLYRYIRHPIYLGEMLVLTAWPFEYGAPLTEVLILIIGVIAIRQRIRYEEVELMALYGDDYAQYMRETDRILPNVW
jgi:protein-S-isoprenylcysteine O-methyltransferase Ste14